MHHLTNQAKAATNRSYPKKYSSFKKKGVVHLLASYEETIGAITDVQWQRKRVSENGAFMATDTGNLVICTKDAILVDLLQTSYVSFKRENKPEWCITIREILLRKFAPKKEAEAFQVAITADSILTIPMPIMLMNDDKIEIFRVIGGKPRGRRWNITEKYN